MSICSLPLARRPNRAFAKLGGLCAIFGMLIALAQPAHAADPQAATTFVQNVANQAIQILRQTGDSAQREAAFQDMMQQNVDLPRVARFTLAKYWRQASSQQQQDFQELFKTYMVHVYSARLKQYSGETVKTTGTTKDNQDQIVVHSEITRPGGGQAVKVDWRVRQDSNGLKLVDIAVEGVSMAITQRSEFNSVIANNGGDINALLQKMREALSQNG